MITNEGYMPAILALIATWKQSTRQRSPALRRVTVTSGQNHASFLSHRHVPNRTNRPPPYARSTVHVMCVRRQTVQHHALARAKPRDLCCMRVAFLPLSAPWPVAVAVGRERERECVNIFTNSLARSPTGADPRMNFFFWGGRGGVNILETPTYSTLAIFCCLMFSSSSAVGVLLLPLE